MICRYHQFGHCKFRNLCRHRHIDDICYANECSISTCEKRHPRECKFFNQYSKCKFSEYCSYSHVLKATDRLSDSRLQYLEKLASEQTQSISGMQDKIIELENENENLKEELGNLRDSIKVVIEKAVSETSNIYFQKMVEQQKSMEVYTNKIVDSLQNEIASLAALVKPKKTQAKPIPVSDEVPQLKHHPNSSINCDSCKKCFASKKVYDNHIKMCLNLQH